MGRKEPGLHGSLPLMKTILVLVGGGDRDQVVLQTALVAARPFAAHLEFLHIHVSSGEAARHAGHAEFVRGPALRDALEQLESKAQSFSGLAGQHIRDFCERSMIEMRNTPSDTQNVTGSFHEEKDNALARMIFHARHNDLIVMGRAKQTQGLAPDTLERLILGCGRPILVAATEAPQKLTGTIMVCWKESDNAARALAAATPFLAKAKRVVFASVAERDRDANEAAQHLARQFAWYGVATDVRVIPSDSRKIADALATAAETCGADLVVMGAYGQSRTHELLFGSCTEAFIRHADRPILLMH
jgi:nucleotide-binding universal stress UspA family protein